VKLADTYGTIAYKYWVKDLVCSREELEQRRNQLERSYQTKLSNFELEIKLEVDRRMKEYRHTLAVPSEYAELAAAEDAIEKYRLHEIEKAKKIRAATHRRIAFARQQICSMDNDCRRAILAEAVKRDKLKTFDDLMVRECQTLAYLLFDVVEDVRFMSSLQTDSLT
jgi:hypothetical protein